MVECPGGGIFPSFIPIFESWKETWEKDSEPPESTYDAKDTEDSQALGIKTLLARYAGAYYSNPIKYQ